MKKEVLVLACVLILNISGIGMGEEDGDLIVAAVSHEVLKRGVQAGEYDIVVIAALILMASFLTSVFLRRNRKS